jgi:hypothetical protein
MWVKVGNFDTTVRAFEGSIARQRLRCRPISRSSAGEKGGGWVAQTKPHNLPVEQRPALCLLSIRRIYAESRYAECSPIS